MPAIFRDLRLFQTVAALVEQRAGIGHRVIQPEPVEIVAQIVVIADIAPRLRA